MGRKLDALLGRNRYLKPSKFKTLANMAISRTSILKNQHRARSSLARADVLQLLNLSYQHRAQLRVEIVIKENNMLDALEMIEDYCCLLIEKVALLQMNKECPGEVKEAISSLIFAASRCGEFPELQEIRRILELKFGTEFASSAVNLRNNCGVSPKMIQKFSTKQPSAETKLKVLKEIASENGITQHLEEEPAIIIKEKLNQKLEAKEAADLDNPEVINTTDNLHEVITSDESALESVKAKKFKDVASATQEAFQSAAYAALAAKAAITLSKSEAQDIDSDHEDGSHLQTDEKSSDLDSSHEPKLNTKEASIPSSKIDYSDDRFSFEKICPAELESCSSEYEDADMAESNQIELPKETAKEIMSSVLILDSDISNMKEQSSKLNSIFYNEPEGDKIIGKENEVASKNEISEDIRVHESK
ncbi:uncharacterized protein LOC120067980 isoform X2 [Benincasa hispida]|uniref:uncharacterized protein LOC120067980 isoform X2 n=1 Tax=Benincasa hispida TaxID=102211 RepID=UPI001902A4E9|nr:uncharacterized protein LOC120067980 isoform X2 [Benincasa hispida]